jgi:hypothetical protein
MLGSSSQEQTCSSKACSILSFHVETRASISLCCSTSAILARRAFCIESYLSVFKTRSKDKFRTQLTIRKFSIVIWFLEISSESELSNHKSHEASPPHVLSIEIWFFEISSESELSNHKSHEASPPHVLLRMPEAGWVVLDCTL